MQQKRLNNSVAVVFFLSFALLQVAPVLFLALSTIPYLSQVSYIGADGLLLSYHGDNDHAFATCSNTSSSSVWYTQPVDCRTGQPFGEAVTTQSMISVCDSWFQEALNDARGYPLLGNAWNKNQDLLIHYITPWMDEAALLPRLCQLKSWMTCLPRYISRRGLFLGFSGRESDHTNRTSSHAGSD